MYFRQDLLDGKRQKKFTQNCQSHKVRNNKATLTQARGKNVLDILKEDFYKRFLLSTITR